MKQPFAYAKRGSDGKWYHWTSLAKIGLTVAAPLILPSIFRFIPWSNMFDGISDAIDGTFNWIDGLFK